MLKANKDPNHEIKEGEEKYYHLRIVKKTIDHANKKINEDVSFPIFDKRGFEQFKKFKPADVDEVEILHDPNFKPRKAKGDAK
jgi:hypothetical protein